MGRLAGRTGCLGPNGSRGIGAYCDGWLCLGSNHWGGPLFIACRQSKKKKSMEVSLSIFVEDSGLPDDFSPEERYQDFYLEELLICNQCKKIKHPADVAKEARAYMCPRCLSHYGCHEASQISYRCEICMLCPRCATTTVMRRDNMKEPIAADALQAFRRYRREEPVDFGSNGELYYFCEACQFSSKSVNISAQSADVLIEVMRERSDKKSRAFLTLLKSQTLKSGDIRKPATDGLSERSVKESNRQADASTLSFEAVLRTSSSRCSIPELNWKQLTREIEIQKRRIMRKVQPTIQPITPINIWAFNDIAMAQGRNEIGLSLDVLPKPLTAEDVRDIDKLEKSVLGSFTSMEEMTKNKPYSFRSRHLLGMQRGGYERILRVPLLVKKQSKCRQCDRILVRGTGIIAPDEEPAAAVNFVPEIKIVRLYSLKCLNERTGMNYTEEMEQMRILIDPNEAAADVRRQRFCSIGSDPAELYWVVLKVSNVRPDEMTLRLFSDQKSSDAPTDGCVAVANARTSLAIASSSILTAKIEPFDPQLSLARQAASGLAAGETPSISLTKLLCSSCSNLTISKFLEEHRLETSTTTFLQQSDNSSAFTLQANDLGTVWLAIPFNVKPNTPQNAVANLLLPACVDYDNGVSFSVIWQLRLGTVASDK